MRDRDVFHCTHFIPGHRLGAAIESIISALLSVEHRPIDVLASEQSTMKTQVSSVGKLMSLTSAMRDAAEALTDPTLWKNKSFTSSDTSVITGSVANGGASGNYNISVQAWPAPRPSPLRPSARPVPR
jgi:flagellar hook-associated protein 2